MTSEDVGAVPVAAPAQALGVLERDLDGGRVGPLADRPLLAVDVDQPGAHELAVAADRLPCVVVGIGARPETLTEPPDLDVLLTDVRSAPRPWRSCPEGVEQALSTLSLAVQQAPHAATALVQVLRLGAGLRFDQALVAESLAYSMLQSGPAFAAWLAGREPRPPRPPDAEPVEVVRQDASLLVTLRRPQVRNAVDAATRDALVEAFDLAACDPTVERVHLRGAGPAFCTGGDLDEFGTTPDPATAHLVRVTRSPARALHRCADRVTVHVHGACIGAGIELTALADRVAAAPDASFQLPEIGMGLIPGAGGTVTIPRRIGRQRTAWMALTAVPVDVDTALAWGLVDDVTDPR